MVAGGNEWLYTGMNGGSVDGDLASLPRLDGVPGGRVRCRSWPRRSVPRMHPSANRRHRRLATPAPLDLPIGGRMTATDVNAGRAPCAEVRRVAAAAPGLLALVPLVLWVVVSRRDHYFRDELYFVIAGRHPDLGYVDFPMLTAVLAALSDRLFGESLVGLRLFPALAG